MADALRFLFVFLVAAFVAGSLVTLHFRWAEAKCPSGYKAYTGAWYEVFCAVPPKE